ncbi:LysR family transcriptional regulator [Roseibium salinum]|nr:LysR family transcriptional regulator [Roseibium salinum]
MAGRFFERRANRALDLIRTGCSLALSKKNGRTKKNARLHPFDHLITSTQLRALLAVGEFGNYSLAARRIGISQPSLHRVARELEKTSGLDFYVKTAQGIELTEPAQFLAQYTRLALSELRQGFEELDASKGIDSARIVVGTLPLARSFILPKAISDLTRVRPGVSISVVDGPYNDLLHGLRHGEIDFIIGALRDPVPIEDVEQQELFRDRLGIYARSGHPLTQKASVTLADLARYPWIISREGTPTRSHFDQFFSTRGHASSRATGGIEFACPAARNPPPERPADDDLKPSGARRRSPRPGPPDTDRPRQYGKADRYHHKDGLETDAIAEPPDPAAA